MTESELKEALKKYQEAKLKEIDEMVDQMEEHEFSHIRHSMMIFFLMPAVRQ